VAALPAVQARALRAALGLGERRAHRFLVAVAVLGLLAEAAETDPVLCLVDDAHWTDTASAETLAFAARRVAHERVAIIFAARDGDGHGFGAPGLAEAHLKGLGSDAASELLDRHLGDGLAPAVRTLLVETAEGNPLALLELSSRLTAAQRAGAEPVLGPLPAGARVEQAFLAPVRAMPDGAQTLLLAVAADDSGDASAVLATAARLGVPADALDTIERAGLVLVEGDRITLRHPLLRSAVYHGATASSRRRAHAALAEALRAEGDADRRAWHRAAASAEPDPEVVVELEAAAGRARRRGGFAAASLAMERAAALTADDRRRARQLAGAGEDAWAEGRPDRAAMLLERARPLTADPLLLAGIDRLRALVLLNDGPPGDCVELACRAAADVAPHDAGRALRLLGIAGLAATYASDGAAIAAIGRRAADLAGDDTPAGRLLARHLRGLGALYAGDFARAAPQLRAALSLAGEAERQGPAKDAEVLAVAAAVGLFLGDDRTVEQLHRRMVARARESGAPGLLSWSLPRLAVSEIWAGQWSSARADLTEALGLARETGQHVVVAYVLGELAIVAALRGDEEACRTAAAESLALASERRLPYVGHLAGSALVALDLALGRAADAHERARAAAVTPGLDFWDALDRIEAAARAGDTGHARDALEPFDAWARHSASAWAQPVAAHCRALVAADPTEAERQFREALRLHVLSPRPYERARTQLAFGEWLRRARRRKEARAHLRAALEGFEALGAARWAERARVELRASGQTARRRDPSTIDELTAQELQIARRVAEGHTNRDIAAQLFLSPRTIDFHLRNIFRKLGLSSRVQLVQLDLGGVR
jgi:DNA-binding CsgD family transcriptional regulator